MIRQVVDALLDWVCTRLGLCITLDGDLTAPDGTEPWWPAPEAAPDGKVVTARALLAVLTDDSSVAWTDEWVLGFLEADGWRWDGSHWVEVD